MWYEDKLKLWSDSDSVISFVSEYGLLFYHLKRKAFFYFNFEKQNLIKEWRQRVFGPTVEGEHYWKKKDSEGLTFLNVKKNPIWWSLADTMIDYELESNYVENYKQKGKTTTLYEKWTSTSVVEFKKVWDISFRMLYEHPGVLEKINSLEYLKRIVIDMGIPSEMEMDKLTLKFYTYVESGQSYADFEIIVRTYHPTYKVWIYLERFDFRYLYSLDGYLDDSIVDLYGNYKEWQLNFNQLINNLCDMDKRKILDLEETLKFTSKYRKSFKKVKPANYRKILDRGMEIDKELQEFCWCESIYLGKEEELLSTIQYDYYNGISLHYINSYNDGLYKKKEIPLMRWALWMRGGGPIVRYVDMLSGKLIISDFDFTERGIAWFVTKYIGKINHPYRFISILLLWYFPKLIYKEERTIKRFGRPKIKDRIMKFKYFWKFVFKSRKQLKQMRK